MTYCDLSLYLVTDREICQAAQRTVSATVSAAVAGGVTTVQLRNKTLSAGDFLTEVSEISRLLPPQVALIINDRVDVYLAARAANLAVAGVHVGQSDLPAPLVRQLIGPAAILGVSAATAAEATEAAAAGADYLGVGVIRATATKTDAPPPLGSQGAGKIAAGTSLPTVAIGGITWEDMAPLRREGLAGAAVVSALCGAADPREAAQQCRAAWDGAVQ